MSVQIDWSTKIITIPKTDTTLVSTGPPEIRTYSTNDMRLGLKALEDNEYGMPEPDTHFHSTEVELSGVTYARIFKIINGYTVTFENGSYVVRLTGTNHNVLDVLNLNNVQVAMANSGGLISTASTEAVEYNGGVTIDSTNSSGKAVSGSVYPTGTLRRPVDNIPDAMIIAAYRGFDTLRILGNITLDTGDSIENMKVMGQSAALSAITINTGAETLNCQIMDAYVTGVLDGNSILERCNLGDIDYINGFIYLCALSGTIAVSGGADLHLLSCYSGIAGIGTPVIDCGGSGQDVSIRDYNGGVKIINKTGVDNISIDLNSGKAILDSTVTGGTVVCRGVGSLVDVTGNIIHTGAWNGVTIINETTEAIAGDVSYTDKWIYIDTSAGTNGDGKSGNPFNVIADAVDFAEARGWYKLMFLADATLERTLKNFTIEGIGLPTIDINGQNVDKSEFIKVQLSGIQVGSVTCREVLLLDGMSGLNGVYKESGLAGDVTCADNAVVSMAQISTLFITSHVHYAIDMGVSNTNVKLNIRKISGAIKIQNCNHVNKLATIAFGSGHIELDNTNTAGEIGIAGIPDTAIIDNSNGSTILTSGIFPGAETIVQTVLDTVSS